MNGRGGTHYSNLLLLIDKSVTIIISFCSRLRDARCVLTIAESLLERNLMRYDTYTQERIAIGDVITDQQRKVDLLYMRLIFFGGMGLAFCACAVMHLSKNGLELGLLAAVLGIVLVFCAICSSYNLYYNRRGLAELRRVASLE